jgi:RraA family protein
MGRVGNRIRVDVERPNEDLIALFRDANPNDLADAMNKAGAVRHINPVYRPIRRCAGPALTVKVPAGGSGLIVKAIDIARPGDVIVIDGGEVVNASLWGGKRSAFAVHKRVAGVVIDGAMRDIAETREVDLPVFARAVCPMAGGSSGGGEVNFPIACGGVVVEPGDIVVADEEGIVVVPQADAHDVYEAWRKIATREAKARTDQAAWRQLGGRDIDERLQEFGTEIIR